MEKFRAYKLTEVDRKIRAEFVDCTLDELDPGELVVRVAYSDVNYKDALAATGKEGETAWLKTLGATEVLLRQSLELSKIKPLDKATWAGAVDNLGGEVLAWMASTMKFNGVIASIGLAASPNLNTTVLPFILRGVSLLGVNSTDCPTPEEERAVWQRLATDMRPPMLKEMARTVPFADLPKAFDDCINAKVTRRVVVDLNA